MIDWTQDSINEFKKRIESASFGLTVKEQLSALSEIERVQKENETLKELVKELIDCLSELSTEYYPKDTTNHTSGCNMSSIGRHQGKHEVCTCGYVEMYDRARAIIQRAQEVVK